MSTDRETLQDWVEKNVREIMKYEHEEEQVGGTHYKECKIEPGEFIEANEILFFEGCVIKRMARHNKPTGKGLEDIEKAIQELQLIKKYRYGDG